MSYLDENGLARYDGLIKNWVTFKSGTIDGIDPLLNWQKTATAGAVTFYPLPAAPIDPTVNFLFTESGPDSGTKGPDNPSTITGVSSVKVTRCGKNLIPYPYAYQSGYSANGVTFIVNEDKSVTISGTSSKVTGFRFATHLFLSAGQYFLSGSPAGAGNSTYTLIIQSDVQVGSVFYTDYGSGVSCNIPTGYYNIYISVKTGFNAGTGVVFPPPQLELGSAATTFEPYAGTDYTVNLGGTYYGGSVDLSAGTMTVTHVMVEPDSLSYDISAHPANAGSFQYADTFGRTVTTDGNTLTITGETGGQIVYNLATPETVSLTPLQIYSLSQADPYTPRINTVYSDQTSVQVGYPKSPIATASELTNAIVSLGSNL